MKTEKKRLQFFSLLGILLLGVSLIVLFSYLTYFSFTRGVDAGVVLVMSELAEVKGVSMGHPVSISGLSIASVWQDVPVDIQTKFVIPSLQLNDIQIVVNKKNLFSLPSEIYIISLFANAEGQHRYISHATRLDVSGVPYNIQLYIVMALAIITFSSIVIGTKYYQKRAIKSLRDWAKSLAPDNLQDPLPNFNYKELNTLAFIIHQSLSAEQKTLAREHHFLRNVSHELRTPIAVINSNLSLLNKMKQGNTSAEQQQRVFERVKRANSTMLHITETLLWLNREDDRTVSYTTLRLDKLVESVDSSLRYLLQGKKVSVEVDTEYCELQLPVGGCHIVIANLLRNAFQHTDNGSVSIKQGASFVSVRNINFVQSNRQHESPISFGLGLKLVKKLAQRFDWKYRYVIEQDGYYVEVHF